MVHLLATAALASDPALHVEASVRTLPNGLAVIVAEDHRTDTVAVHLAYGVGSRDEQPGELGCAHLFEHLMFEGSRNVPRDKFDGWLTAAGGDNNAYTSEDVTAYHETFPSGALDLVLFLESDRMGFLDAGIDAENVDNQRKVVLQERAEGYAEPNGRDWDALWRRLWPDDHPYHHPVIGTLADVQGFQPQGVLEFWRRHYRPSNAVLAIVGNVETEHAFARAEHWFSDVPDPGPVGARPAAPEGPLALGTGRLDDAVEERTLTMAWRGVPIGHADELALDVLGMVLDNGRGTPLPDALYYDRDLASSVWAAAYPMEVDGAFLVSLTTPAGKVSKLEKAALRQIELLADEPPTADQVDRAKQAIRAILLDRLEYPANVAETLADCWRRKGLAACLAAEWDRYGEVGPADVQRVAREYLVDKPYARLVTVPRDAPGDALDLPLVELP